MLPRKLAETDIFIGIKIFGSSFKSIRLNKWPVCLYSSAVNFREVIQTI